LLAHGTRNSHEAADVPVAVDSVCPLQCVTTHVGEYFDIGKSPIGVKGALLALALRVGPADNLTARIDIQSRAGVSSIKAAQEGRCVQ
jgi:hypothetical protein